MICIILDGVSCQAYDIIINTTFYKEKILTSNLYWTFLCVVSMEALDEKHKVDLEKNDYVVMKHKACHGKPQPQFVRDKARIREVAKDVSRPQSTGKSLIQEIDPAKSSAAVKGAATKAPVKKIECEPPKPKSSVIQDSSQPVVRELSTKVFKKPQDPHAELPTLKATVYRNKGSKDTGVALVDLKGMQKKDYADVVINCKRDTIEVICIVGKCHVKSPINIVSFYPEFDFDTNILKIILKLEPMDEELLKEWKDRGHELPEYDPSSWNFSKHN